MRQVIIIIIIIITTMFMVLSSWQSHCESSPGSSDECRMAPSGRRPKTKPDDLGCESACTGCQKLHPPSPFIVGEGAEMGWTHPVGAASLAEVIVRRCSVIGRRGTRAAQQAQRTSAVRAEKYRVDLHCADCRLQRCSCLKIGCCC